MNAETRSLSYYHAGGAEPLLGATISEHFAAVVDVNSDRLAVISRPQDRRLTYGELAEAVNDLARGLVGLGYGRGDRIGVWSTDNIEWLMIQMATARIGAVLVTINPAYRPRELAYALERAEVQGLFLIPAFRTSDYAAMMTGILPSMMEGDPEINDPALPLLRRVIVYDPADPMGTIRPHPGFTLWREVIDAGGCVDRQELDRRTAALDRDDVINIQFTSGTTGFPKAVMLSHHNILNNATFAARRLRFTPDDRLCVPVPFYHCFGMVLANLLCLSVGASVVIAAEHFDAEATLEAVAEERCTALHGVPTMFIAELEHPRFADYELSSLRTGIMAGAPCPEPLMKRVIEDMFCSEILIGYGQTEASPLTHLTEPDDSIERRTQTVGCNMAHQEVKIVGQDGETLPVGAIGEVCFRGYHVMTGYYGDAQATDEAIDAQGWLHSGDLGTMDADGYLRITGRLKEMIIRGGENVYPAEIEACLFAHPKIAQAAVFGITDERLGEEIMAWVQPHEGEALNEGTVHAHCAANLAHFKVPRYVWIVDDFPTTVIGKLQKFRMREIVEEKMRADFR